MKACLSARCSPQYLAKADEIKVAYKDRNTIIDYVDKYDATIVLDMRVAPEETDWEEISRLNTICREKFIFGAVSANQFYKCNELGIKFYFDRPISRYEDIQDLRVFKPEYLLIETPLFFELEKVKVFGIPVRLAPNLAYYDNWIPKVNGLYGSWVRPEDMDLYEGLIDTVEFVASDARQEEAYYRVYFETKTWPGELEHFIVNFRQLGVNNGYLPRSFTEARLNCGQKCQSGGSCKICAKAVKLSNNENFQERLKAAEASIERDKNGI